MKPSRRKKSLIKGGCLTNRKAKGRTSREGRKSVLSRLLGEKGGRGGGGEFFKGPNWEK